MSRYIALFLSIFSFAFMAHAETSECPADTEQTLYTMVERINAGEQKEIAPVLDLAKWAIETCEDRSNVQALAAMLMSVVSQTATDAASLSEYVTLTERAIIQNDAAWRTNDPKTIVTKRDGTSETFFGYNYATGLREKSVLLNLVRLWQNGRRHPLVSGEALQTCPFAQEDSMRLTSELTFWDNPEYAKQVRDYNTLVTNRFKSLLAACPDYKLDLNYALAENYGKRLKLLTDWTSYSDGVGLFGTNISYYRVPAYPAQSFSETEMLEKKTELDAQAQPLADPLRKYINDYKAAYAAIDTSDMSFRERSAHTDEGRDRGYRIKTWETAIAKLEAE